MALTIMENLSQGYCDTCCTAVKSYQLLMKNYLNILQG